jgi:hypothetical protein
MEMSPCLQVCDFPKHITAMDEIKNGMSTQNVCRFVLTFRTPLLVSAHSSIVVKALSYKPKGRGFDTR